MSGYSTCILSYVFQHLEAICTVALRFSSAPNGLRVHNWSFPSIHTTHCRGWCIRTFPSCCHSEAHSSSSKIVALRGVLNISFQRITFYGSCRANCKDARSEIGACTQRPPSGPKLTAPPSDRFVILVAATRGRQGHGPGEWEAMRRFLHFL